MTKCSISFSSFSIYQPRASVAHDFPTECLLGIILHLYWLADQWWIFSSLETNHIPEELVVHSTRTTTPSFDCTTRRRLYHTTTMYTTVRYRDSATKSFLKTACIEYIRRHLSAHCSCARHCRTNCKNIPFIVIIIIVWPYGTAARRGCTGGGYIVVSTNINRMAHESVQADTAVSQQTAAHHRTFPHHYDHGCCGVFAGGAPGCEANSV
jgi:hypothetical protein